MLAPAGAAAAAASAEAQVQQPLQKAAGPPPRDPNAFDFILNQDMEVLDDYTSSSSSSSEDG